MIAILDYKAGNQTSVLRALKALGVDAEITDDSGRLLKADGVIFPGVGAAGQAMARLKATGQDKLLRSIVAQGTPLLGVCLGCQILLDRSEENDTPTLSILPGVCRRFQESWTDGGVPIKIPHMGWNSINIRRQSPLLEGIADGTSFYFVHSFYPDPAEDASIATTSYGVEFPAIYGRDGLWAVQFHPEKSGPSGLRLLQNFDRYCREAR